MPEELNPGSQPVSGGPDPAEVPGPSGAQRCQSDAWRTALRQQFEAWLAQVDAMPSAVDPEPEPREIPDLYSFHAQLVAATAEARRANRRTAEVMNQWGEVLSRFDQELQQWREGTESAEEAAEAAPAGLNRPLSLALVELFDRLRRLEQAFAQPPPRSWWSGAWPKAWEAQRQAFDIVVDHFEALLRKEGITRLEVEHQPFDPTFMVAVAAVSDPSLPHHTVIEEVAAGYQWNDELLRPAQVKVSTSKSL